MAIHKITHVAIKVKGVLYARPSPFRHQDVIRDIVEATGKPLDASNLQGFLDSRGKFLERRNALDVALKAGQVKCTDSVRAGRLFSEDLW